MLCICNAWQWITHTRTKNKDDFSLWVFAVFFMAQSRERSMFLQHKTSKSVHKLCQYQMVR